MTVRRFNQTGRVRIARRDAKIAVRRKEGEPAEFDAHLRLAPYELDPESDVVVEAYRQATWMRFEFGKVAEVSPPEDRRLDAFDAEDVIRFRVKVIDRRDRFGCVRAEADQIRPDEPDERGRRPQPLLPTRGADIGHLAWRVEYAPHPILVVNSRDGDWKARARSPEFMWYVYPAVLTEVLHRVLLIDGHRDAEDLSDWRSQWLRFGGMLPGVDELAEDAGTDDAAQWTEDVAQAFARKHRLASAMREDQ